MACFLINDKLVRDPKELPWNTVIHSGSLIPMHWQHGVSGTVELE